MHRFGMCALGKCGGIASSEENNKSSKLRGLLQSSLKQKNRFRILFVSAK